MTTNTNTRPRFRSTKLAMALVDLAGYMRATRGLDAVQVAELLDRFYRVCAEEATRRGGKVIKCIGDAVLAVFPDERCTDAVDTVIAIRDRVSSLAEKSRLNFGCGANVHLATVAEGEFGPAPDRFYDIIGPGVNQVFVMGGGSGCRISEPVYRQLPNDRRGAWAKEKPPAIYHLRA